MKHRLIQDNNGHWFVILAEDSDDFYEWVEAMENCEETDHDFSGNGVDGPHTVTFNEFEEE